MQFSMYDSVFAHWKENNISSYLFKFLMVKSFSLYLTLQLEFNDARTLFELRPDISAPEKIKDFHVANQQFRYRLAQRKSLASLWQERSTNNKYLLIFKTSYSSESFSFWTFRKVNSTVVISFDLGMNGLSMLVDWLLPLISLERRWSSHTFRYGYLVTTSPQLPTLP